jgi:lysine 2,3-aminomutase
MSWCGPANCTTQITSGVEEFVGRLREIDARFPENTGAGLQPAGNGLKNLVTEEVDRFVGALRKIDSRFKSGNDALRRRDGDALKKLAGQNAGEAGDPLMTIDSIDTIPDTPLPDLKPARGRFNSSNVIPSLQRFYSPEQIQAMRDHGVDTRMMFGINPYYMALVQGEQHADPDGNAVLPRMPPSKALEALVVPILTETVDMSGEKDPSNQIRYSPDALKGKILHKYDEIVLGYTALACSAHCRYCYRLDLFNGSTGKGLVKPEDLKAYIVDYNATLAATGRVDAETGDTRYPIREVLLSGGDPMVLSNKNLYKYMAAAAEAGVHLVRIGTKEMAFRPQRFDTNFSATLDYFHRQFPDVHVNFVVHFTHPDEILERDMSNQYIRNEAGYRRWLAPVQAALDAVRHFDFVSLENQTPIIARVNDDPQCLHVLQEELRRNNVKPKYLFQCREIEGHTTFAVPVEKAWALHNESQKGLSDTARSRFAMSTEDGKLEVVSVTDGQAHGESPNAFDEGLVVMKIHRSPHSAASQGDLIVARRNPDALWLSYYEDSLVYDGRRDNGEK